MNISNNNKVNDFLADTQLTSPEQCELVEDRAPAYNPASENIRGGSKLLENQAPFLLSLSPVPPLCPSATLSPSIPIICLFLSI